MTRGHPLTDSDVVFTPADTRFDHVVEGISALGLSSLWLVLEGLPIDGDRLGVFLGGFRHGELHDLHAWHVSDGGYRSVAIKEKLRAFGQHTGLAAKPRSELTLKTAAGIIYSDTARVEGNYDALAQFLSRSTSGSDAALAFVPIEQEARRSMWGHATLPLLALWLGRRTSLSIPSLADHLMFSFIEMSVAFGAVPIVLVFDESMRPAIVAFGPHASLATAAVELKASSEASSLSERLARGMRPQSLP